MSSTNSDLRAFRATVWNYYKKHGRHSLPWRNLSAGRRKPDPYKILVSEIMLQQTQVDRVVPKYKNFLKRFPSVRALQKAPLAAVLREWQGLGYNRRAKMLWGAAQHIVLQHNGTMPKEKEALTLLPGIGPYTASAVRVFAFNEPDVLIETNVRSAFIHHFFPKRRKVPDSSLLPFIKKALPQEDVREWYSALMDYGSYLKSVTVNPSRKSAHHVKQKPFKGSDREIRGAILKMLAQRLVTQGALLKLPFPKERIRTQLEKLLHEGLVSKKKTKYLLG